jgi:hypothetical protein
VPPAVIWSLTIRSRVTSPSTVRFTTRSRA